MMIGRAARVRRYTRVEAHDRSGLQAICVSSQSTDISIYNTNRRLHATGNLSLRLA